MFYYEFYEGLRFEQRLFRKNTGRTLGIIISIFKGQNDCCNASSTTSWVNRELHKGALTLSVYFKDVLVMVKLFTK